MLNFKDATKPLVLNQTVSKVLVDLFGENTEDWDGQTIELFPTTCEYRGDTVDCVRVREATANPF